MEDCAVCRLRLPLQVVAGLPGERSPTLGQLDTPAVLLRTEVVHVLMLSGAIVRES